MALSALAHWVWRRIEWCEIQNPSAWLQPFTLHNASVQMLFWKILSNWISWHLWLFGLQKSHSVSILDGLKIGFWLAVWTSFMRDASTEAALSLSFYFGDKLASCLTIYRVQPCLFWSKQDNFIRSSPHCLVWAQFCMPARQLLPFQASGNHAQKSPLLMDTGHRQKAGQATAHLSCSHISKQLDFSPGKTEFLLKLNLSCPLVHELR